MGLKLKTDGEETRLRMCDLKVGDVAEIVRSETLGYIGIIIIILQYNDPPVAYNISSPSVNNHWADCKKIDGIYVRKLKSGETLEVC